MSRTALLPEDEALFSKLRRATVDSLWDALNKQGLPDQFVNGRRPEVGTVDPYNPSPT